MVEQRSVFRALPIALGAALLSGPFVAAQAQPAPVDHTVRTRTLAWTGGERLFVATHADVRYVQGGQGKVVITGPADEIADIVVDDGVIRHERERWGWGWEWWKWRSWTNWRARPDVHIVVTAPRVSDVGVSGSGHLDLGRLAQDQLDANISGSGGIDASGQFRSLRVMVSGSGAARFSQVNVGDMSANISGSGWIKAQGAASSLHVGISGSGAADMGALAVQDVDAHLSGSGGASLSPKRTADVAVSGSGAIRLLTEPARLIAHRSGSGAIIHPGGVS
jgi:hypothetical protein